MDPVKRFRARSTGPVDYDRVVVTGLGIVCAVAPDMETFCTALRDGRSGIGPVRGLDLSPYRGKVAGQVQDFKLEGQIERRRASSLERSSQLALHAAQQAVCHAQLSLDQLDRSRIGVVLGSSEGGSNGEAFHKLWLKKGIGKAPGALLLSFPPSTTADVISVHFGLRGPKSIVSTASAAGANAIAYGGDLLRSGKADILLVGGVTSLTRLTFAGLNSAGVLAEGACEPFGRKEGLTPGESAGIMVMERLNVALRRGAAILVEVLGYGLSADAYHLLHPDPTGNGAARAIWAALADAGLSPADVDYIHPHGVGILANDLADTKALKAVFRDGAYQIPVSSVEGMTGHTMAAAGAVAGIVCVLSILHQFVPPTVNLTDPAPGCDLDYVPTQARSHPVNVALATSCAFGGNNVAVLYGRYQPQPAGTSRWFHVERQVVVTGIGVVSCVGVGKQEFWNSVVGGLSGLGPIRSFDASPYACNVAGEVPDTRLSPYINPTRLRRLDAVSRYAVASVRMALSDAQLNVGTIDAEKAGVILGTATGPIGTVSAFQKDILLRGPSAANPILFSNTLFNAATGHACMEFGLKGYTATLAIGDASALNALAYAYELLKCGVMDVILVVSADECNEALLAGFSRVGLLSREPCRPFHARRDGITLSAAATAFVLETVDHAIARGARIYGQMKGYGMNSDGYQVAGLDPSGQHWAKAITAAVEPSRTDVEVIDYVASAATGLPVIDLAETRAIKIALGERAYAIPVSAIRSMVGHAGSSGPALALAASLIAMHEGLLPPTVNLDHPDKECDLFYIPHQTIGARVDNFLVNAFACGGSYVTVLLGRWSG